ncbi:MAG: hypothetical protein ABEH40_05550 [Haloferacaceae archaeon]
MTGKPDWWRENERIRASLDLPAYEPPRFADGTYTHEVVEPLEAELGVGIRFVAVDPRHGDDWTVRVDGDPALTVGRRRDDAGNTVYEIDPGPFERRVRAAAGGDPDGPDGR